MDTPAESKPKLARTLAVRLPETLYRKVAQIAEDNTERPSAWVRRLLTKTLR